MNLSLRQGMLQIQFVVCSSFAEYITIPVDKIEIEWFAFNHENMGRSTDQAS